MLLDAVFSQITCISGTQSTDFTLQKTQNDLRNETTNNFVSGEPNHGKCFLEEEEEKKMSRKAQHHRWLLKYQVLAPRRKTCNQ